MPENYMKKENRSAGSFAAGPETAQEVLFPVAEMFASINGEGVKAGQLAYFLRFRGCNLSCSYCDTKWANEPDCPCEEMTVGELTEAVLASGIRNVTLTGGEPMLQKGMQDLLDALTEQTECRVEIETNGSVDLSGFHRDPGRVVYTMDYKLPGSGMEAHMRADNFAVLQPEDTVKFVAGSPEDLARTAEVIHKYSLTDRCHLYISPVFGRIDPADIVDFMKENQMNGVNLQLQLHKFIWDSDKRGV